MKTAETVVNTDGKVAKLYCDDISFAFSLLLFYAVRNEGGGVGDLLHK